MNGSDVEPSLIDHRWPRIGVGGAQVGQAGAILGHAARAFDRAARMAAGT